MKKADLKKVAEALNKVLELDEEDQIDTDLKPKELEKELKKCVGGESPELDIYEEDEFSEEVWELLAELGNETAMKRQEEAEDEEAEEEDEDEDNDEEGEVEEEKGTEEEEEEEKEEETEGYTWEEINTMKKKDLVKIIKEDDLDIDPNKYPKLKDLKEAVFEEVGVEEDEENEYVPENDEQDESPLSITESNLDSLKKKDLLSFIESEGLDIDTDQSVKNMKKEIKENYELTPEPEVAKEAENPKKQQEKKSKEGEKSTTKKKEKTEKSKKITKYDAACIALKNNPKSFEKALKNFMDLYSIKESNARSYLKIVLKILEHFDVKFNY